MIDESIEVFKSEAQAIPATTTMVALSTMIGTTIEWYDFFIFGTASALIFGHTFFSGFDPTVATILSLSTFAAGLFARPLGAIFFGHFGDRIGRKKMLIASLLLMGVPTTLIGMLPTYSQIGVIAPIALTLIRVCQGIALGGEWGGAVLMAVEHAPEKRSGFFGSLPQTGCPAALVLSSGAFALTGLLGPDDFQAWGWRLPFLASGVLIVIGFFIRRRVNESPVFERVENSGELVNIPVVEIVRKHLWSVTVGVGAKLGEITMFWLFAVFVLSYSTTKLGLPRTVILQATTLGAIAMLLFMPISGLLSDRFGNRKVFVTGTILLLLSAVPMFTLIDSGNATLVTVAIAFALGILYPIMYAPEASLFAELFPPEVRYTGLSLCANIGGAIGGGIAPLVATGLVSRYGGTLPVGFYLAAISGLSLVSVLAMKPAAWAPASSARRK
ncbi:MFS transporter [Paraburkholderia agricolaris]|uniref:MFS transporter n=1 Tax=Paraburkholderia agricolaris TaxID=2152888 RepID=UPI0038BDC2C2